jgi:enoyl-CoA hydratase
MKQQSDSELLVTQTGSSWTLELNRPHKRNALSAALVEDLIQALETAHQARADVLVFKGVGKNFCAGFDFSDFDSISDGDLLWRFVRIEQLLQSIHRSDALTVAFAHGRNFGAGVDLMAACKYRVATEDATFRMPGLKFGLILGTRRLAGLIGAEAAREIQQVAATFSSGRALELGLLNRICATAQWDQIIVEQCAAASALTPQARANLYRVLRTDTDEADMAALVCSIVGEGLRQRIADYRAAG